LAYIPKLVDIIAAIPANHKSQLLPYVKAKPIRTASGVAVVAVMSKPHRCPHIAMTGNVCVYDPSLFLDISLTLPSAIAPGDLIQILNILLKLTLVMNPQGKLSFCLEPISLIISS
jgi:hypothetical protein